MELHLGTCGKTWQHLATSNFISKDAGSNQSLQDENFMLGLNLSITYLTSLILSHPIYFNSGFYKSFLLVRYRALLPSSTESGATPADRMSQTVQAAPRFFQAMARKLSVFQLLVTRQLDCLQVFP
jgi:hypothetical protein